MPVTFRVPLQVDVRGRLATTTNPVAIVEQRILDFLMTNYGERVMLPNHGADLMGFIFQPALTARMAIKADEIKQRLNAKLTFGEVTNVRMRLVESNSSSVILKVEYRMTPAGPFGTVTKMVSGTVTEETVL